MTFPSSSADDAMALCSANGTVMQSVTGGGSWEHCTAEGKFVAENAIGNDTQRAITGTGVPTGYTKGEGVDGPAWIGPFTSTSVDVVSADRATKAFNFTRAAAAAEQITWDAPPNGGLVLFSPASGGTVALDDSGLNFIATPWLWYGDTLPVAAGKMCCNGSVVAYATSDGGRHWEYRSEILSKQSLNKLYASEEGPNENDIVRLSDDSLLVVIRKDGGDGVPHHYHVPYVFASSTDKGHTWSIREAPKGMLSARPRAVSLSGGATFIAGGRPGLDLWISQDATAATIAAVCTPNPTSVDFHYLSRYAPQKEMIPESVKCSNPGSASVVHRSSYLPYFMRETSRAVRPGRL
jgi:hypothetical protein